MITRTQVHVRQPVAGTESPSSVTSSWLAGQGRQQWCTDKKGPTIKTTSDEWMPDRWNCKSFKKNREREQIFPKINIVNIMYWAESNSFEPPQQLTVVISNADH